MQNAFILFPLERIRTYSLILMLFFFPFVKDPNNLTESSRVTVPCSKESEVRQLLSENHCSPQKTEKPTQTAKSTLPQPVQSKEEPVKGTHVQLEPKGKPTPPGKLVFQLQ